jgi:hypothetical protein
MSIALNDRRNDYTGNNTTIQFSYDYRILAEDYLKVVVTDLDGVETVLTLNTDYTVAGVGSLSGGYVELVDANQAWLHASLNGLKTGYTITINGQTPVTQTTDIRNQGPYYPSLHEDALDKLTMIAQELVATVKRAPLFRYATGVVDRVFPNPDPGKAIIWGPTGQLENTEVDINAIDQAVSDTTASAAAALASETAAAASETAAAASALAADASADAAAVSEANAAAAAAGGNIIKYADYGSVLNADLTIPNTSATYSIIPINSPAASRTITLPLANTYPRGRVFFIVDVGGNAGGFPITVQRSGSDTIEGSTSVSINAARMGRTFTSNGVDGWLVSTIKQQEVGSAQLADNAVTTAKIGANAVTQAKRAALGQQVSSSSGSFSTTSTSLIDITNLSVTITTTGRPVYICLVPSLTAASRVAANRSTTALVAQAEITFVRDATTVFVCDMSIDASSLSSTSAYLSMPTSMFSQIDTPAAGTYVYKARTRALTTSTTVSVTEARLFVYEL